MDYYISRQAAIEVLELAIADDWEFGYAKDRMNELPSSPGALYDVHQGQEGE